MYLRGKRKALWRARQRQRRADSELGAFNGRAPVENRENGVVRLSISIQESTQHAHDNAH
jgi:hypothetical protein